MLKVHTESDKPIDVKSSPESVKLNIMPHLAYVGMCVLRGASIMIGEPLLLGNLHVLRTEPPSRVSTRDPMLVHFHNTLQLPEMSHVDPFNHIARDSISSCGHIRIYSVHPTTTTVMASHHEQTRHWYVTEQGFPEPQEHDSRGGNVCTRG